jgi:purine-binding chemotaxis protein CheW
MEKVQEPNRNLAESKARQLCGFRIGKDFYAIPVLEVQEVVKPQVKTSVPLAPEYIDGLINLRGQVVTAINMRRLLKIEDDYNEEDYMNIIVKHSDGLYSLVVDEVLDVMEVEMDRFSETPPTLEANIKNYIHGVFKLEDKLLILLNLNKVFEIKK